METLKNTTAEVIEIEGKLVYNRARIMKRAHALVKKGVEFDLSSALRRAWRDARKQMEKAIINQESKIIRETKNKDFAPSQGDFSDSYKPDFITI